MKPRVTDKQGLIIVVVLLFLAIGFNTWQGQDNSSNINKTAVKTCKIQSRGLSAQPHLTSVMQDILTLLTEPSPPPAHPSRLQIQELAVLTDLDTNLKAYVAIEGTQPKSRSC